MFLEKICFTALRATFIIVVTAEVVLPKSCKEINRSEKLYIWICIQEYSNK